MILLAIDTSTRYAGVALDVGDGDVVELLWRSEQNHGMELMPAVIALLDRRNLSAKDITHIAVALGPGGFSAVRVGISAAIGLALPSRLPVVGISTHELEAEPHIDHANEETPLYTLLPAGRGQLAWARFVSGNQPVETGVASPDAFVQRIEPDAWVCGELAETLSGHVTPERILSGQPPTRSVVSLTRLARSRIAAGTDVDPAKLRPIYARPPSISEPKPLR